MDHSGGDHAVISLTGGSAVRVLVTGAAGQLGRDVVDVLSGSLPVGGSDVWLKSLAPWGSADLGATVLGLSHSELDVSDRRQVEEALSGFRPDTVIHGAAWTAVDACEGDPERAMSVNGTGTANVVAAAGAVGAHVVYVSTDYVFDGTKPEPYLESDATGPLSVYGRSKLAGENEVGAEGTIVRTSWVCGYHGANMVKTVLRLADGDGTLSFVDDQHGSPTFTADLAPALIALAGQRRPGIFHLTNSGATTWFELVRTVMSMSEHDPSRVLAIATSDLDPPRPAPRPANSVLANASWRRAGMPPMPTWQDGLGRLVSALLHPATRPSP